MINSRKIEDLNPIMAAKTRQFIAKCTEAGIDVLITCTFRDNESQEALYAIGRTRSGARVTNARAGQSFHNYRLAFDCVPLRGGKPVWGTTGDDLKLWQKLGQIGKSCGLEWAGEWESFREFPHFQYAGGLSLADLQAGKKVLA